MKSKYLIMPGIMAVVIFSIGITLASRSRMKFYEYPDQMEKEILRVIPQGTPIADAKKIMEQNSFECEYKERSTFSRVRRVNNSPELKQELFSGVDYLDCTHTSGFLVYAKWMVAIPHKNKQVKSVVVNYGLIGL